MRLFSSRSTGQLVKNTELSSHRDMPNNQTKLEFLNSLLSDNHTSSAKQTGQNESAEEETPNKMTFCRSFEKLDKEDKASPFASALKKFSSLSTSNISCTKATKPNHSTNQTKCNSSQTEDSSSTSHSQGTQTEDVEEVCQTCWNGINEKAVDGVGSRYSDQNYRDIYQTFYYQHGQIYATLV
jgi:hypothetical protein